MWKDKLRFVRDYVTKNSKIVFPGIIIIVVAITVSAALGAAGNRKIEDIIPEQSFGAEGTEGTEEVPLVKNGDEAISDLIYKYYNAQALGDIETLEGLCDEISDLDKLSFKEKANYIEYYPKIEIYTKTGMDPGETIVYVYYRMTFMNHEEEFPGYTSHYVCTDQDGKLYIKRSNFSDELNAYTSMVCKQNDVVEFNNRVKAEYDAFKEEYPELADYPDEVMAQVNMAVGVKWSEMQTAAENAAAAASSEANQETGGAGSTKPVGQPEEEGPLYATATTTVNVRSSDSERADKLGKVTGGSRIQVLEQRVNGWSKVLYEKKEGYIKSEFLLMEESAAGQGTIGKVRATTNINVRSAADQNSSKLGVLTGGDTAELISVEGEWCKIKYQGKVAYVKAEYVEQL